MRDSAAKVLIVQDRLPHYRVPLFEQLRDSLAGKHIQLDVAHGGPTSVGRMRGDEGRLAWARPLRQTRFRTWAGREMVWQSLWRVQEKYDLVVLPHQSRYVSTFALLRWRRHRGRTTALWGMTENFTQAGKTTSSRWGIWGLRSMTRRADWYFSYTNGSNERLLRLGYPPERTTVLQNAIDISQLQADINAMGRAFSLGDPSALFVGSLHKDKELGYLFEACQIMADRCPGFRLIVVGDGPLRPLVGQWSASAPWMDFRGAQIGADKARALAEAWVVLSTGQIGLGVLDAFAASIPLVLREVPFLGPEAEYAVNDVNALVLPATTSPSDFARSVVDLLHDNRRLERLQAGAKHTAEEVTLGKMIRNFEQGIIGALSLGPRRD